LALALDCQDGGTRSLHVVALCRVPDAPCASRCSSAHRSLLPASRTFAPPGGRTATRLLHASQARPPCLHPLPPVSQARLTRFQSLGLCHSVQDVRANLGAWPSACAWTRSLGPCQPRPRQKTETAIMVVTPSSTATVLVGSVQFKAPRSNYSSQLGGRIYT
jgi:hypothetical protein